MTRVLTEAWRGRVTCLRLHSQDRAEPEPEPILTPKAVLCKPYLQGYVPGMKCGTRLANPITIAVLRLPSLHMQLSAKLPALIVTQVLKSLVLQETFTEVERRAFLALPYLELEHSRSHPHFSVYCSRSPILLWFPLTSDTW